MKNNPYNKPLFLGLSHIGQVYSIAWAKKVGQCSAFDFEKKNLANFKKKKFTQEERNLSNIKFDKKKIYICKNINDIKNFKNIFFTYDTPLNNKGYPKIAYIENKLKKIFTIKFKNKVTIIITSQVYPGFTDYIKDKYLNKNKKIKLVYMVDTLKMGTAIDRFLNPEQLIFGYEGKDKNVILNLFKKFKCKKYIKSFKEAELIKISINLYLYFSVNFANIMDNFSKQIAVDYTRILENLKNDKRIGINSYISPSPGISGGHLERDVFYIKKNDNLNIKSIFSNFEYFNDKRKNELKKILTNLVKKKTINLLIIGLSYKDSSFSTVNSIFQKIFETKKIKSSYYDSYFKKNITQNKKIKKNLNLRKGIHQSDVIILNYCNSKDFLIIKKSFNEKNTSKFLINISLKYKKALENNKNIINYYSNNLN